MNAFGIYCISFSFLSKRHSSGKINLPVFVYLDVQLQRDCVYNNAKNSREKLYCVHTHTHNYMTIIFIVCIKYNYYY